MRSAFKGYGKMDLNKVRATTVTLTADNCYISPFLVERLCVGFYDRDGFEYNYSLYAYAQDPETVDKLTNL